MLLEVMVVTAGLETVELLVVASSLKELAVSSLNDTTTKLFLARLVRTNACVVEGDDPGRVLEEAVHLLERSSLGLGQDQPEGDGVGKASDGKEDVVLPSNVLQCLGRDLTNHEVGNPAADAGQSGSLGSDRRVHDLDRDRPRQGTDSSREEEVKDPDHGNESATSMLVEVGTIGGEASLKGGGDGKTSAGHGVADNERPSTTELVDKEDAGTFADERDDRVDALQQEDLGVGVAKHLEDLGRVVLNGGNTGHLHRKLEDDADSHLSHVLRAAKDLAPATGGALFHRELCLDLGEFGTDKDIGGVAAGVEAGERAEGILLTTLCHEPSRRLGEEHDEESQGNGGSDLKSEGESPFKDGTGLVDAASVDDEAGDERTDTEEELLKGGESASNGRMCDFALIKRRQHGQHSNADASKETACHHHALVGSGGLEGTTDDEDDGTDHDGESARKGVGNERSGDATHKGTEQHRTDDEADIIGAWVVGNAQEVGCDDDTGNDTEICARTRWQKEAREAVDWSAIWNWQ